MRVTREELNFEEEEPEDYFNNQLDTRLEFHLPVVKVVSKDNNIFKNADFWLSKGYHILNKGTEQDSVSVALDYFLSGVKIEPDHYDCIYNVGCCQFVANKFKNAKKWFDLAIKMDKTNPDAYYNKAVACIRLGLYPEAEKAIATIDNES